MSASAATVYSRRVVQLIIQTQGMAQAASEANRSLSSIEKSINAVKGALYAFGLGRAIDVFRDIADSAIAMNNILSTLNKTTEQTAYIQGQLNRIANDSRAPVDNVTKLYVRLDAAMSRYGKSETDVLKVTKAVTQGLKLGGATAGETASAILQLSQAFASGRLQGDEFRAVLENAPRLAQELTHQLFLMGTIGEDSLKALRKAASAGELGTPELFEAFLRAAPEIQTAFLKLTPTLSEFFTMLRNQALDAFTRLNERFRVLTAIADAMKYLTNHVEELATALIKLAEFVIARLVITQILAFAAAISQVVTGVIGLVTGVTTLGAVFAGLPAFILLSVAALGIFLANAESSAQAFDKLKRNYMTLPADELKAKVEQLRQERDNLVQLRASLSEQDKVRPKTSTGLFDFEDPSSLDKMNNDIAEANRQLEAASTALEQSEAAMKSFKTATDDAAASTEAFDRVMADFAVRNASFRLELEALHRGNVQQYKDIVDNQQATQDYLQRKKAIEDANKKPLTPEEDKRLRDEMEQYRHLEQTVKDTYAAVTKAQSEAAQAAETASRKRQEAAEREAKAIATQIENITAFDKQVQDIREARFEAEQGIAGVGLDPQALEQMQVGIKNVRDWRILENSAIEKHIFLTAEEIEQNKVLINSRNQAVATAKRQQEEFSTLQDAAKSQDPVLGLVERYNTLQAALDEVGSKLNAEQLRAVKNEMADIQAHMIGIGAAAERLKGMDNPFASLLEGVAKFQEANAMVTQDTAKSFELVAQGTLGTLGFITEQMRALGIENFEFQKAVAMSTAAINAAVAITEVFKSVPYPANFALAGIIAGLTGAQIAVISNQQPPARASGGAVSAGMPYNVGERGAEMYSDTGGRQIFIPSAAGTISPNSGRGNVNIINTGAPVRVVSKTEKADGGIDIVVASVKAVEDTFEKSLRTGQGKFAKSLQQNTSAGRRY